MSRNREHRRISASRGVVQQGTLVLNASFDLFLLTSTDSKGASSIPLALPNDLRLVGFTASAQWLVDSKSIPGVTLVSSPGLELFFQR